MQFGPLEALTILSIGLGILAFFVLRVVALWYFRINEIVTLLQRIAVALEAEIAAVDAHGRPPSPPSA